MKHMDWMTCCLAFVGLLMVACSDKSDELGGGVLEPAEKSLVFPQKGGTRRVAVKTGGQEWSVKLSETAKDWCSAQALGDALEVTVGENNAPKSRNTRLALNSDGLTAEVEVKQMGSEPMIELGQKSIILDGDKNSFSIEVGANVPYDIIIEDDWIWHKETPDTRAGLEVVTVEFGLIRNTTGEKRDTKIIFLSEDGKIAEELKVTQKVMVYGELNLDEVGDRKIKIERAEATSFHSTCPVELSFDDDPTTYYHSDYKDNLLPVVLTYHLTQPETIDYFLYMPRQDKRNDGSWGNIVISVEKNNSGTFEEIVQEDFGQKETKSTRRYDFSKSLTEVTAVRFEIKDGFGDRASCAEMQFYQKNTEWKEEVDRIFTSSLCEELKPGIGEKEVSGISNSALRVIAEQLLDGTYNKTYRVQEYEAYPTRSMVREQIKNYGNSIIENPTGIWFEKGEEVLIFVDDNVQLPKEGLQIIVVDLDGWRTNLNNTSEILYNLYPGVNKITMKDRGLGYIPYFTESWETAPKLKINVVSGKVNGYFDYVRDTDADWQSILDNTTYGVLDMKGQYVNLTYGVNDLRQYCKNPTELLKLYNEVVRIEYEVMGLFKYNIVPKNHMWARVGGNGGTYADGKGVNFPSEGMKDYASDKNCINKSWPIAHEFGHNNQISPDLKWRACGEVTNNIYSACVRFQLNPNDLTIEQQKNGNADGFSQCSGRINGFLTSALAREEIWFLQNNADLWAHLCPFWQLMFYFRYIIGDETIPGRGGYYKDWFGDLQEIARKNKNDSHGAAEGGYWQCKFMKDVCRVLNVNLTDYYTKAGMLKPRDMSMGDPQYAYEITENMVNDVKAEISQYPPLEGVELVYASANAYEAYKNKLPLQGGTVGVGVTETKEFTQSGYFIDENVWKNAVAFEVYRKEKLNGAYVVRSGAPGESRPRVGQTFVYAPLGTTAIYAVGYDGKRLLVWGTSNGIEN